MKKILKNKIEKLVFFPSSVLSHVYVEKNPSKKNILVLEKVMDKKVSSPKLPDQKPKQRKIIEKS